MSDGQSVSDLASLLGQADQSYYSCFNQCAQYTLFLLRRLCNSKTTAANGCFEDDKAPRFRILLSLLRALCRQRTGAAGDATLRSTNNGRVALRSVQ